MIQVKDLESGYGKLQVLRGINLDIEKGDLVAIIGPNGSGKSTTLKCIFGLLKTWKGTIKFNKNFITNKRPDQIVKLGISYVPQGRLVFQTMTVLEIPNFKRETKSISFFLKWRTTTNVIYWKSFNARSRINLTR